MLIRLLIFFIGGVLIYRTLKSILGSSAKHSENRSKKHTPARVDDVMVKDPICGTYFPQRVGVRLDWKGQVHCFCSNDCRDRFLAQIQAGKTDQSTHI